MKPIKLTMQAFGPYKSKQVIDFTHLKDQQLFVISGNTGAGKTTIFDGIAFALYGQASGEDREDYKSLRSDFADDQTYTQVELVFAVRDKVYRVLRQLPHIKAGRKTASGEDYMFVEVLPDGSEVNACEKQKSKEISQKIEEIIGLTYDQFSQIVMLPQGEFRKMLTSDTENKELIFRKIFKTERYSEIANQLETKKKMAEKQRDEAKSLRDSYIDQIAGALPERESLLFEQLQADSNIYQITEGLQQEKMYYEERIVEQQKESQMIQQQYETLQKEVATLDERNKRVMQLQQKQQQLEELTVQKPQYDELKGELELAIEAQKIEPLFKQRQTLQSSLQAEQGRLHEYGEQKLRLDEQLVATHEQVKLVQQTVAEQKQLELSINELQQIVPLFDKVKQVQMKLNEQLQKENGLNVQLASTTEKIEQAKVQQQQYVQQETAFYEQLQQLPNVLSKCTQLEQRLQQLRKYETKQSIYTEQQQQFIEWQQKMHVAQESYEQARAQFISNQAAELALMLVDGEPCPVCGSTAHTHTTSQQGTERIHKEQLEQLHTQFDQVNRTFYSVQATKEATAQDLQLLLEELQRNDIDITLKDEYVQMYNTLQVQLQELQQAQQKLQQTQQQRQSLEANITSAQQHVQTQQQQLHMLQIEIEKLKYDASETEKQIPAGFSDVSQLQHVITSKQTQLVKLQQAQQQAQKNYENATQAVVKIDESIAQTNSYIEKITQQLITVEQQYNELFVASPFKEEVHFIQAQRSVDFIRSAQQRHNEFEKMFYALQSFVQQQQHELQHVEIVDLQEQQQLLHQLRDSYEQSITAVKQTQYYVEECKKYNERLLSVAEKIVTLEQKANQILNLYNMLKGQNSRRISFERYVQISYLEEITHAANIRLKRLSNGQFELVSSDRQVGRGRKSGLSLDVYDSYTGQKRDVKTLSGGEKFNASLCLALGMADVIQSHQGNVKIDTMFIDEGFGTLDEESLMRAIDTLVDLQKSGRMIGVISHVAELKAIIPAVLEVTKLKQGYSEAQFVLK